MSWNCPVEGGWRSCLVVVVILVVVIGVPLLCAEKYGEHLQYIADLKTIESQGSQIQELNRDCRELKYLLEVSEAKNRISVLIDEMDKKERGEK